MLFYKNEKFDIRSKIIAILLLSHSGIATSETPIFSDGTSYGQDKLRLNAENTKSYGSNKIDEGIKAIQVSNQPTDIIIIASSMKDFARHRVTERQEQIRRQIYLQSEVANLELALQSNQMEDKNFYANSETPYQGPTDETIAVMQQLELSKQRMEGEIIQAISADTEILEIQAKLVMVDFATRKRLEEISNR